MSVKAANTCAARNDGVAAQHVSLSLGKHTCAVLVRLPQHAGKCPVSTSDSAADGVRRALPLKIVVTSAIRRLSEAYGLNIWPPAYV